jgi:uncharacterized protein YgiM (DUF1202 family)
MNRMSERRLWHWIKHLAFGLAGALLLTACPGGAPQPPEIKITSPESGAQLNVGQSIAIVGTATGEAISRVDVIIDGTTYATLNAPDKSKGVPSFPINVPWTPLSAGTHAIQLKAYGPPDDKLLTQSEPLVLIALAADVPEALAPPPEPTQPPAPPTQPPPTQPTAPPPANPQPPAGQPSAGQPPAPPPAGQQPPADAPSVTVTNEFVNVRTGPDVAYPKIGELRQGQVAPVRGKSADGRWWQISFPAGPGGVGWVINDYVQANSAAANAPVAAAPPRPTAPPPPPQAAAPTPPLVPLVPVAPQPTPVPQGQLVGDKGVLRVNANPVPPGSTVIASWNIPNFKSAEFDHGDGQGYKGPAAQAMQVVVNGVINAPRTIRLRWTTVDNQVIEDSITINVSGQASAPQGQLVGPRGVLRVNANPVPYGATVFASWNIPNFRSAEFDHGDGQGYKGPAAQAMQVTVNGPIIGPRVIRLRWTTTDNQVLEDTITINVSGQAQAYPECNPSNPDWQANKPGNPSDWEFCKRKDFEYVGDTPPGGNIAYVPRENRSYTMAWEIYGIRGIYIVFEQNGERGPAAPRSYDFPTTGTGPYTFNVQNFENGCYKMFLRIDTNTGKRTDFGQKFLCVGVGGGGGGGNPPPTAPPPPPTAPPPTPTLEVTPIP